MKTPLRVVVTICTLLVVTGGCDPQVERFQENDAHYSIFGYLDASADTQFVRIEPLRDGLATRSPLELNAEVTLTNLDTDRTVSLRDSVFRFEDEALAHNLYTTVDIEPTASYRLRVQGPEQAESRVQTTIPESFPPVSVLRPVAESRFSNCTGGSGGVAVIDIQGIDRVVAIKALLHTMDSERIWGFDHRRDTVHTGSGGIRASVNVRDDYCEIPLRWRSVNMVEIVVAAGGAGWPDFWGLEWETEALPTTVSNVEGGVGFLGGVVTDTVVVYPFEEGS